jgi:TRAP-type mannitol/chloroaromatic compound transport system substrate-binding protein
VWKGLSGEHRAILRSAAATENDVTFGEFNARNNQALETLTKRHGVKLRRFPSSVLNAVGTAAGQVVRAAGRSDAVSSKVYDSFIAFRHRSIAWSKLSDQAFWNARLLPFKYKR